MKQQRTAGNVLNHEIAVTVHQHATVPADIVFDVLANLSHHMMWGGAEASTLLSMQAPRGRQPPERSLPRRLRTESAG